MRPMWLTLILAAPLVAQPEPPLTRVQQQFRPLTELRFAQAAQADFMKKEDRVLGVNLNGVAKAYLVRMVTYHHIVHDQFVKTPVVVTW